MSDEFDETFEPRPIHRERRSARRRSSAPAVRLAARLYAAASAPLREQLLACLLKPLGTLGVAAAAAGSFAVYAHRRRIDSGVSGDDVARYSREQIVELARYVEQVDSHALQHFAGLVSNSNSGAAGFSAAVAALLLHQLRQRR